VDLGLMPELNGASEVLFRFEDVALHDFPGDGVSSRYTVLLGGGEDEWWLGARHKNSGELTWHSILVDGTPQIMTFKFK